MPRIRSILFVFGYTIIVLFSPDVMAYRNNSLAVSTLIEDSGAHCLSLGRTPGRFNGGLEALLAQVARPIQLADWDSEHRYLGLVAVNAYSRSEGKRQAQAICDKWSLRRYGTRGSEVYYMFEYPGPYSSRGRTADRISYNCSGGR